MSMLKMFRDHLARVNDNPYYDTTDHTRPEYNDHEMIAYFDELWAKVAEARKERRMLDEKAMELLIEGDRKWRKKTKWDRS